MTPDERVRAVNYLRSRGLIQNRQSHDQLFESLLQEAELERQEEQSRVDSGIHTPQYFEERQRQEFGYTPTEVQQIFRNAFSYLFEEFGFRETSLASDILLPNFYKGYGIEAENGTIRVTAETDGYDKISMVGLWEFDYKPLISLNRLTHIRKTKLNLYEASEWDPGPKKISKIQIERHAAILYEIGRDILAGDLTAIGELVAARNRELANRPTHYPTIEQMEKQSEDGG